MKSLGMKVFVIDAPRPFQHHPMFEQCRKDVLMHLDREYRRYILNELAARDIDVIATPDECVDAEGFMLAEFRHPDVRDRHHANEKYGEIMARRIVDYLADKLATSAPTRTAFEGPQETAHAS